jgi:hypothetical protein
VSAAADRGRELARQAHDNAVGKTRLNMCIHDLEVGLPAVQKAGMDKEAIAFEQAIWELTNLLTAWPPPVREQGQVAS